MNCTCRVGKVQSIFIKSYSIISYSAFYSVPLLHKQPESKSNLTTDNPQNTCVQVTSINFRIWCFCDNYLKDIQCLLYLEDHGCYCMLSDTCRMFSGYYICKIMVVRWSVKLRLWFRMQLAKYTIHNHCLLSLSATRVTTQWSKQPICFCSACAQHPTGDPTHLSLSHPFSWQRTSAQACRNYLFCADVTKRVDWVNTVALLCKFYECSGSWYLNKL